MRKLLFTALLFFTAPEVEAQAGKYAGKYKTLINSVYSDSRNIPGLKGWSPVEASVLNPLTDSVMVTVDVFKKGEAFLIFFSITIDSARQKFRIVDVLEIPQLAKGTMIKTSFCLQDGTENPWIVAVANVTRAEYLKGIRKAWRFDAGKRQIEAIPVKGISCLNEGFDLD
jgi:hypothetical protein